MIVLFPDPLFPTNAVIFFPSILKFIPLIAFAEVVS